MNHLFYIENQDPGKFSPSGGLPVGNLLRRHDVRELTITHIENMIYILNSPPGHSVRESRWHICIDSIMSQKYLDSDLKSGSKSQGKGKIFISQEMIDFLWRFPKRYIMWVMDKVCNF